MGALSFSWCKYRSNFRFCQQIRLVIFDTNFVITISIFYESALNTLMRLDRFINLDRLLIRYTFT